MFQGKFLGNKTVEQIVIIAELNVCASIYAEAGIIRVDNNIILAIF